MQQHAIGKKVAENLPTEASTAVASYLANCEGAKPLDELTPGEFLHAYVEWRSDDLVASRLVVLIEALGWRLEQPHV
jgi:hypothetical protein